MIARSRVKRHRARENSSTPQIIIRLLGRSIRSHAVSTAEIFSRLGIGSSRNVSESGGDRRPRLDADRRAELRAFSRFALK